MNTDSPTGGETLEELVLRLETYSLNAKDGTMPDSTPGAPRATEERRYSSEDEPLCSNCGAIAACYGSYEAHEPSFSCDTCCGHGSEDGRCEPVADFEAWWRELRAIADADADPNGWDVVGPDADAYLDSWYEGYAPEDTYAECWEDACR